MDSTSRSHTAARRPRSHARRRATGVFALALVLSGARTVHAGGGTLDADNQEVNLTALFRYPPPQEDLDTLEQSLIGGTDRASYEREADISSATASTDFRRLLDAGLITQVGRGRNIRYHASDDLRAHVATSSA